jgi:hypothetical protein
MPLNYERAFGGADTSHKNEAKHAFETSNLVGVGFHARRHKGIRGTSLPNLEHPEKLLRRPTNKPPLAGFGFIARNWQPRCSYAGTYDQDWMDERFPFLPLDFDDRYFQGAPEDQTCSHLQGGEHVKLTNLTPEGLLEFSLPILTVPVKLIYKTHQEDIYTICDTVIIEPDARRCILVWRASTCVKGKPTNLREVWVGTPSRARMRAMETGKRYIDWSPAGR